MAVQDLGARLGLVPEPGAELVCGGGRFLEDVGLVFVSEEAVAD